MKKFGVLLCLISLTGCIPAKEDPTTVDNGDSLIPPPASETPPIASNSKPIAQIIGPEEVLLGEDIILDGSGSYDNDGDEISYKWFLNDKLSSRENRLLYKPNEPGLYTFRLIVNDGISDSDISNLIVSVKESTPPATVIVSEQYIQLSGTPSTPKGSPFTFATVFKPGELTVNSQYNLINEAKQIPLQTDVKATYEDGSVKHAIFSGLLTYNLDSGEKFYFSKTSKEDNSRPLPEENIPADSIYIDLEIGNETFRANLANKTVKEIWLNGEIVQETLYSLPLVSLSNNTEHRSLTIDLSKRKYIGIDHSRYTVIVDNTWSYQARPQNYTYNFDLVINGNLVKEFNNIQHLHASRWKTAVWSSPSSSVDIQHDPSYLIDTKIIPSYDKTLIGNIFPSRDEKYRDTWNDAKAVYYVLPGGWGTDADDPDATRFEYAKFGPMGIGYADRSMPGTGGRDDIGPLPTWAVSYLLSQSQTSKKVMLGMADLSGSWPIHYRDKDTSLPISINRYPYIAKHWNPSVSNAPDGHNYHVALCEGTNEECSYPYIPDSAHQPSLTFLPYLVTGEYYYLEELLYWTNYNFLKMNPVARGLHLGLFNSDMQDRGQAWSMRTLAQASAITPDNHSLKEYFSSKLLSNIEKYNEVYLQSPPNDYGMMTLHHALSLPWQDDFFTWAIGYTVDLGFSEAEELAKWKSKFSVSRMGYTGDEENGYCWIFAAPYHLIGSFDQGTTAIADINQLYHTNNGELSPPSPGKGHNAFSDSGLDCNALNFHTKLTEFHNDLEVVIDGYINSSPYKGHIFKKDEMQGFSKSATGFPSNLQIALATAVDSGIDGALKAWQRFEQRSVKPNLDESEGLEYNYKGTPNYAIVPRTFNQ